ncbi:myosin-11-like [Macrobrachium nipponense]|uniref:myosin-11-like n=1 Tax=Macrobrachium nipponense TaxID=159736 RepID=UPI0030C8C157
MAQVPAEGPEDFLVISEEVLPSWSFGGILRDNLYAGLLGGLCGLFFILFLKHQDGKLACETAVNSELRIRCELEVSQDNNLHLEKELDEAQEKNSDLLDDKTQMARKEDALLQRIQDLEKDLSNEKNFHAEEILDLTREAGRKIQEAEDTVQVLKKENRVLKKINDKTEDLIFKQEEEICYLNGLITAKNSALMNDRQCIEELHKRVKNLEEERKSLQDRLNECEADKVKTAAEMEKKTSKLEGALEFPLNESKDLTKMKTGEEEQEKDGKYFIRIVDKKVTDLEQIINSAESDLETFRPQMSEEVQGKVLAATGKARLLIAQKVEQFRGLCQQNIDGPKGDEPTILAADLEGFWDMVSIQVENVHHLFKEISVLKTNGWKEDLITLTINNVTKGHEKKKPMKVMKKAMKSSSQEQKSRDEARKKLLEERRKAMKEALKTKQGQPDANGSIDGVEILVAEEKITHLQENLPGEKEDEQTKNNEGGPGNEKTKDEEKQGLIYNAESDLENFKPEMSEEVQGKKERMDHLNLTHELKVKNEMEWQINKSNEEVGDFDEKYTDKRDDNDQLSIEKTVQINELAGDTKDFQEEIKEIETEKDNMRAEMKSLSEENGKLKAVLLENRRRESLLEGQVKRLTEEVMRLNEMSDEKKEQDPSDTAELQRIINKQADQIQRLRKKVLEMEEESRQREADFQEWERTAHTVRKENSELKVILKDLSRKKGLFIKFEECNKVLEEEVKDLKRKMDENRMEKEKEIKSFSEEIQILRRQLTEELTVSNQIRNEKDAMALHIKKLETENADYMKDVAYFKEWFVKDYTNHCADVEDCLDKFLEASDRHQLLLKEKLQLMRNARDSDEVEVNGWQVSPNSSD